MLLELKTPKFFISGQTEAQNLGEKEVKLLQQDIKNAGKLKEGQNTKEREQKEREQKEQQLLNDKIK